MKLTTLICLAARERFGQGASLGVRLSPIHISAAEVAELAAIATKTSGWEVFVAVAAPGAEPLDQARVCVSSSERAAERATAWRNIISPKDRQRILYVSAEEQGRAGGLRDTLQPLGEDALREAFLVWAEGGQDPSFPSTLGQALRSAGVAKHVSVRALCDYSERAVASASGGDLWQVAGAHLPTLGLLYDSALTAADASARIAENAKLVKLAARGDLQALKRPSATLRALTDALSAAFRSSVGYSIEAALADLDLAQLSTEELVGKPNIRAPKQPKTATATPRSVPGDMARGARVSKPAESKPARAKGESSSSQAPSPSRAPQPEVPKPTVRPSAELLGPTPDLNFSHQLAEVVESNPLLSRSDDVRPRRRGHLSKQSLPPQGTVPLQEPFSEAPPFGGERPDKREPLSEPTLAAMPALTPLLTTVSPSAVTGNSQNHKLSQQLWRDTTQARFFGEVTAELKPGLAHLLNQLDQAGGYGLYWSLAKGPLRRLLETVPQTLSAPTCVAFEVPAELSLLTHQWKSARSEIVGYLMQRKQRLATLVMAPLRALGDGALLEFAEALVGAAEALFQAALVLNHGVLLENFAALETITLGASRDQERLVLLGPLHPLWLGQQAARARALFSIPSLDDEERRLAATAARAPQAAPTQWVVSGERPLMRGEGAGCLTLYETLPLSLSDEAIYSACSKIFACYLSNFPHARLSACVELRGRVSAAAVEGLVAGAPSDLCKLEIRLSELLTLPEDSLADKAVASGLLNFSPIMASGQPSVSAPHIIIWLDPHAQASTHPPSTLKALTTEVAPLEVRRLLTSQGLSTLTGVRGVIGAEAAEALLSKIAGKPAMGAFWSISKPHALSSLYRDATPAPITWRVVVSSDIVSTHEGKSTVVFCGCVEGTHIVVTAEDTAPLTRALEGAIAELGLSDHLPQLQTAKRAMINALSKESIVGMIGLDGSGAAGRVLSTLLARAIRLMEDLPEQHIIIPLSDVHFLAGNSLQHLGAETLLCAAVNGDVLTLTVGCVSAAHDAEVEIKRRSLDGRLGKLLDSFVNILLRANVDDIGGQRARELIGDLLWPVLAVAHAEGARMVHLKTALERLQLANQHVSVRLLLLLKSEHPMVKSPRTRIDQPKLSIYALEDIMSNINLNGRFGRPD